MADGPSSGKSQVLYLVRHGEAKTKDQDPQRSLTETGARTVARMAHWAARVGVRVDQIWQSGKLRAQQTATIFGDHLAPRPPVSERDGLNPNDDVQTVAGWLQAEDRAVMLVGHLPFLSRLVSVLVCGEAAPELVELQASGLVALHRREGRWVVVSVVQPADIPEAVP